MSFEVVFIIAVTKYSPIKILVSEENHQIYLHYYCPSVKIFQISETFSCSVFKIKAGKKPRESFAFTLMSIAAGETQNVLQ